MEPLREIRNRLLNGWQLSKMHTFEVAARHQSFALAAEELSLSPSAVSHRINQLEEELGIQLFVRSHRKVELTHEGKRVYWALKSSLDTLNQEILDIKNQELSGTLTLYSRPSIAQCWLVPALGDFTRRYAEGKKLDQAVGSLQNSQSEESFRRNAGVILNTLNQKRNEAVGKYVQQNGIKRVEAPQASIDYLKQHPELSIDFINRYGYLPSLGQ